jgi:fatty acid kinase
MLDSGQRSLTDAPNPGQTEAQLGEPRAARSERAAIALIDGDALARAFAGGTAALQQQADAINAINVFPIPDGDTGTNMHLTMRAALDDVQRSPSPRASEVAKAMAHGALMGAKGNSGVILSQILAGFAAASHDVEAIDARVLADGLKRARAAAYTVVSAPEEGTILTAITAAAMDAASAADRGADVEATLAAAVEAAEYAVARTPDLLPVLKEAGVVDSGAQGLFVLLEGMLSGLRGEETAQHRDGFGAIDASWLGATQRVHAAEGTQSGFCTEFVISGERLDADEIRDRLRSLGDSLLVVGGGEIARVHIHTQQPDEALAAGRLAGTLVYEKVDDMEAQFRALAAREARGLTSAPLPPPAGNIAVVAVGAGAGIEDLLRSMGASVVRGGQTMNPSAGEIRAAVEATGAAEVVVLPNNKNVVMAARQAIEGLAPRARVIETRSVPEGVAALIALNTESRFDDNVDAMQAAASSVRHAEVTLAARATKLHGIDVREGQPIGIVDGDLQVAESTVADAVRACIARMVEGRDTPLVTLYAGEGEDDASAGALAGSLRERFGVEVEVVRGGQPHYPYLIGVE